MLKLPAVLALLLACLPTAGCNTSVDETPTAIRYTIERAPDLTIDLDYLWLRLLDPETGEAIEPREHTAFLVGLHDRELPISGLVFRGAHYPAGVIIEVEGFLGTQKRAAIQQAAAFESSTISSVTLKLAAYGEPGCLYCQPNSSCVEGECVCDFLACGEQCCGEGQECFDSNCCTPGCGTLECGPDECGHDCGTCEQGFCDHGVCGGKCPEDWWEHPQTGGCFRFGPSVESWDEARTTCEGWGSLLATITSEDEEQALGDQLGARETVYWLGATDQDSEGAWSWLSGETWGFEHWCDGEPDNLDGTEHWLAWDMAKACWQDRPATIPGYQFICELPAGS